MERPPISGFLEGEDCLATLRAFRAMGVRIEGPESGQVTVHGVGLHGLHPPAEVLDMGNSGTSMRLMAGILAGQTFDTTLMGDASLMRRPMRRVTTPLALMGACIDSHRRYRAITDSRWPALDRHRLFAAGGQRPGQILSVLLAGLYAQGITRITEPAPTRDHTERMLEGFGYPLQRDNDRTVPSPAVGRLLGTADRCTGGYVFSGLLPGRRQHCSGFRSAAGTCWSQSDPHRGDRHSAIDGRRYRSA
jgi:3-phosphoshikimate 1-carboxyvinyltransferase